jgi:cytochrome c peroxidase
VQKNQAQFTPEEQKGKDLFFSSQVGCSNCHRLSPSSGNIYYDSFTQSHNIGLDLDNPDPGVGAITKNSKEEGAFITPVLMNVEFSAPYMHDGRFKTLEEVVEHYNSKVQANPNLDPFLKYGNEPKKLNLTDENKANLIAFLKTLSDPAVISDKRFSDPFVARNQ